MTKKRESGIYQGTFTMPMRIVRLAKIAAIDADMPLGQWVGSLVQEKLRELKLVEANPRTGSLPASEPEK